jgi:hypothetical protein
MALKSAANVGLLWVMYGVNNRGGPLCPIDIRRSLRTMDSRSEFAPRLLHPGTFQFKLFPRHIPSPTEIYVL